MSKKKVEGKKVFKMHASENQVMVKMNGTHGSIVEAFVHAIYKDENLESILEEAIRKVKMRKILGNDSPLERLFEIMEETHREPEDKYNKDPSCKDKS